MSVVSLPGTFAAPDTVLAGVHAESGEMSGIDRGSIAKAFLIGDARVFDDAPRLGLIVLSEIASRALSPAVNDPGTAIDVIGMLVRLFVLWSGPVAPVEHRAAAVPACDRVEVPELSFRTYSTTPLLASRGMARPPLKSPVDCKRRLLLWPSCRAARWESPRSIMHAWRWPGRNAPSPYPRMRIRRRSGGWPLSSVGGDETNCFSVPG